MELSRILTVLCLLLLSVCLVFCFCSLVALRQAVDQADLLRAEAIATLSELKNQIRDTAEAVHPEDDALSVDVLYDCFWMRESGGRIAIYTSDGDLVRLLDISVSLLPVTDQEALAAGISLSSWKEVLSLIEDFGG